MKKMKRIKTNMVKKSKVDLKPNDQFAKADKEVWGK